MFRVSHRLASCQEASQDRVLVLHVGGQALVVAVADGQGSGTAAQRTLDTIRELAPTLVRRGPEAWRRLLLALDDALVREELGQTALVVLCLTPRRLVGASVGSAEAWWVGAEGHYDLTEAQSRKPLLGSGEAVPAPFMLRYPKEGALVVATDGLFKYVDPLTITEAVRQDPSAAPEVLLKCAESPKGRLYDDVSILTVSADRIAPWTQFLSRFKAG